jgi:hypothetical protein
MNRSGHGVRSTSDPAVASEARRPPAAPRGLVAAAVVSTLAIGLVQAWTGRTLMNQDGLSYLDVASAYARGDFDRAVNPYWSPLFSWILAPVVGRGSPSALEPVVVHGVQWLLLVFATWAFHGFLRAFVRERAASRPDAPPADALATWAAGYGLFAWALVAWNPTWTVSPDLLVSGLAFLALWALLASGRPLARPTTFLGLGAALGVGYLGKAAFLPVALVFLGVAAFVRRARGLPVRPVLLSLAAFVAVVLPWAAVLSARLGRPTTGEVGRLAYAWLVNGVRETHWQGEGGEDGTPTHPTRKIHDDPPCFEFAEPVGGSYPVWYDKAHWYDGLRSRFVPANQARALSRTLDDLWRIVFRAWPAALAAFVALAVGFARRGAAAWRSVRGGLPVLVPALAFVGLYALVHVEGRYLAAPFVAIGLVALDAAWLGAPSASSPRAARAVLALALLASGAYLVHLARAVGPEGKADLHGRVAEALGQTGVAPGARVGYVCTSVGPYWARLAGTRIVAEVRHDEVARFWAAPAPARAAALHALARAGAEAVVADGPPRAADRAGWTELSDTGYFVWRPGG